VGERLPTERELTELCEVSRSSVREALGVLRALNIVDRRTGDGTYVCTTSDEVLSQALEMAHGEEDLHDVFEFQRILEVGVAELAARAMTADFLIRVEEALLEMEQAASQGDIETYFASDRNLHLAIAQATGNDVLKRRVLGLIHSMNRPLWRTVKRYFIQHKVGYLERSVQTHRRLVDALRLHDTALARRVMEEHFDRLEEEIFGDGQPK
jgi:GntR family transcriptional repressor for pyruvate dehydrogenase complex